MDYPQFKEAVKNAKKVFIYAQLVPHREGDYIRISKCNAIFDLMKYIGSEPTEKIIAVWQDSDLYIN